MNSSASAPTRLPRFRYSLAGLLVAITLCAVALTVWKRYFEEPFTHSIPLYEKAPATSTGVITVGPNQVKLVEVRRWKRDGATTVEDGQGRAVKSAFSSSPELVAAAKWMDIAEVVWEPVELLDVMEVRVFDHRTRSLLTEIDNAYGWQMTGAGHLQIYGLGKNLPEQVDVWLRLHSYQQDDPVYKLAARQGATCELPGGTLTLEDIRPGSWNYSFATGLQRNESTDKDRNHHVDTVIAWQGKWDRGRYQIAAVSKSGRASHPGVPAYILSQWSNSHIEPIDFHMGLDEIDHFELRPFGGGHRFYFDSVQLPKADGKKFAAPPSVVLNIKGQETQQTIAEFKPLKFQFETHRGRYANGTSTRVNGQTAVLLLPDGDKDADDSFTVVYDIDGIGKLPFVFQFQLVGQTVKPQFLHEDQLGSHGRGRSVATTNSSGYMTFSNQRPLETVEAIRVMIDPTHGKR